MKSKVKYWFSPCLLALALVACQPASESEEQPTRATEAAEGFDANAYWDEYEGVVEAGDVEGMLAYFTEDTVLMESFQPALKGKEAARGMMESTFGQIQVVELDLRSDEVRHADGWLLDIGTFTETIRMSPDTDPVSFEGKYVAVLESDDSGNWLIDRVIANSDAPPPPEIMEQLTAVHSGSEEPE